MLFIDLQITALGVPTAVIVVHTLVYRDRYDLKQALLGES